VANGSRAIVRRAASDDVDAVLGVLAEGQASAPPDAQTPPGPPTALQLRTWARMLTTPDLTVYLADLDGQTVGTAATLVMPHLTYDCRPTALVEAVVVKYAYRRRGIARQLLDHAVADAHAAGCLKVQLLSHKRHATDGAHRLYESAGFRAEAEGFRLYLDGWRVPS